MVVKPRGSVTIPNRPIAVGGLLSWAKAVNMALRQLRDRSIVIPNSGGRPSSVSSGPCSFGEIITYQEDEATVTGIRGGLFQCGDMNFSVPNQTLDLETDGKWFIQIILTGVTPNVDDDEEIFLPEIETATGTPTWDFKTWTDGGNYDSTTNPASPGSTGELVIPIGILTIADGSATLDAVSCGNILATQCAGILNHSRGNS